MSVVIYYIDSNYKNRTRLINIRRLYEDYSGENQADLLLKILNKYKLADLVGYFVLNNITTNDVCIEYALQIL